MRFKTLKLILLLIVALGALFFSNNFGLVDIERTTIITAVALDRKDDGDYELTAQIAMPEASNNNNENLKTMISVTGGTVGAALKKLSDLSGWYPNLNYCNLILVGRSFTDTNLIKVVDYFNTTFRLQDSALIAMCDIDAKEILALSSPLDNITSFAIQRILIKTKDFENGIVTNDIKSFCEGYYSPSSSSFMPVISINEESTSNNDGSSGQSDKNSGGNTSGGQGGSQGSDLKLFNAERTAIFKKGYYVGELSKDQSFIFNNFKTKMKGASFELKNLTVDNVNFYNYLLTIFDNKTSINLVTENDNLLYKFNIEVFCKIADQNTSSSQISLSSNKPLPDFVQNSAKEYIENSCREMINTSVQTDCDFLDLIQILYRQNNNLFKIRKENYLQDMKTEVHVTIVSQ